MIMITQMKFYAIILKYNYSIKLGIKYKRNRISLCSKYNYLSSRFMFDFPLSIPKILNNDLSSNVVSFPVTPFL